MDKFNQVYNKIINEGKRKSYNFYDMKRWAKRNQQRKDMRIVYGTRTNKFHLITRKDRDWDIYAVTPVKFLEFENKNEAVKKLSGSIFLR